MEKKDVLTSVKVDETIFDEFKIECIRKKFSLNKLVNAAMYLYITDEEFRKQITLTALKSDYNLNDRKG